VLVRGLVTSVIDTINADVTSVIDTINADEGAQHTVKLAVHDHLCPHNNGSDYAIEHGHDASDDGQCNRVAHSGKETREGITLEG
jgi:hypothetical protein